MVPQRENTIFSQVMQCYDTYKKFKGIPTRVRHYAILLQRLHISALTYLPDIQNPEQQGPPGPGSAPQGPQPPVQGLQPPEYKQ